MTILKIVHGGAGRHPKSRHSDLIKLCEDAAIINSNTTILSTVDSAVEAVSILEDNPLTNAGFGSNLTRDGRIECEAGLMHSSMSSFAGVSGLNRIKNPVKLCQEMIKAQTEPNPAQLLLPIILSGSGAESFAKNRGLEFVTEESLITEKSKQNLINAQQIVQDYDRLDTVGCVTINSDGDCAAACSSGGIVMKHTGRVGHAPIFGSGCFAYRDISHSAAVSVSGSGESLIRTQFAQKCAEFILQAPDKDLHSQVETFFTTHFWDSKYLINSDETHKQIGAIVVKYDHRESGIVDCAWLHNTPNFAIAYDFRNSRTKQRHRKSLISIKTDEGLDKVVVCCTGFSMK